MNHEGVARAPAFDTRSAAAVCAVPLLVALGYAGLSHPLVAGGLLAIVALAAWAVVAYQRPALAVSMSFPLLLLAGTKLRTRSADASLAGVIDAQIVMELLLFGIVGVGLLAAWLATRGGQPLLSSERRLVAYAALALVSTFWSAAPALTLVRGTQLAIVAGAAMMAVHVLTPGRALWTALRAAAAYVLVCAVLAATIPAAATTLDSSEGFRFAWFATHPIDAGTLAAMAALGLISLATYARTMSFGARQLLLVRVAVVALLAVLVLTRSRGPLLAFAAAAGVLWLMRVRPAVRTAVMLVGVAVALTGWLFAADLAGWLAWMADQNSVLSHILFRGESADTVLAMNGRLGLWSELMPTIFGHLFVGYGYQASRSVLLDAASWAAYAHNAVLQTLLDLGVVGALALLAIVVSAARAALRRTLPAPVAASVAALMVFLLVNSVSTESFAGAPGFEATVLFLCAVSGARGDAA